MLDAGLGLRVLSLFDGISCGRVALKRAGIPVSSYYASEVDKHAKTVSHANWGGSIVQVGDVTGISLKKLGYVPDLIIGGSPCQGFSFAGRQLNFNDPRSALFFDYVRLLNEAKELNPNVKFLLENVKMKKEYLDIISSQVGVQPVCINSALVSAQNRVRYYWANWEFGQPEDKGLELVDIIDDRYPTAEYIITASHLRRFDTSTDIQKKFTAIDPRKAICMTARQYANWKGNYVTCGQVVGRKINPATGKRDDYNPDIIAEQRIELRADKKTNCLTTVQKDNVLVRDAVYRKLTPIECERLQTLPDGYTASVANTHRYKALGNGWTVDVIAHILTALRRELHIPRHRSL